MEIILTEVPALTWYIIFSYMYMAGNILEGLYNKKIPKDAYPSVVMLFLISPICMPFVMGFGK